MIGPRRVAPVQVLFVVVVACAVVYGYLEERASRVDLRASFGVLADERPTFEEFSLPPGPHVLRGEVRTQAGTPAAGVQVFLYRSAEDHPGAEPLHLAISDDAGHFEIDELAAARYGVVLHAQGTAPRTLEVSIPQDGEVAWSLNPELEPVPVLPEMRRSDLVGQLQASDPNRRLEDFEVVLRPAARTHPLSGAIPRRTRPDAEGRFHFEEAVAADYELELLPAWASGGSWPVLDRSSLFHSPDSQAYPVLQLAPGSVSGLLVEPEEHPIEGALVQVWPVGTPERLWPPVQSRPDGRFVVMDLPAGRYRVRLHAGRAVHEEEVEVHQSTRSDLGAIVLLPHAPSEPEDPSE